MAPGEADAASSSEASDAAKAALETARQAEAADRPEEAIQALKRAYELTGDADLLFRLGELTHEIGQEIPAVRFYRAYLMRDPRGKHRAAAERQLQRLDRRDVLSSETAREPSASGTTRPAVSPMNKASANARDTSPTSRADGTRGAVPVSPPRGDAAGRTAPGAVTTAPRSVAPPGAVAPAPLALGTSPAPVGPQSRHVDLHADSSPATDGGRELALPRWLPWTGLVATLALGTGATVYGLTASHRYDELHGSCGASRHGLLRRPN